MTYKCSHLLPDRQKPVDNGTMNKEEAFAFFKNYDWRGELRRMQTMPDSDICYSPSVKYEDTKENKWIELSAVGEEDNFIFYIFYKRKKEVTTFFGFRKKMDEKYVSDRTDVSYENTLLILEAFFDKNWDDLEKWF